MGGGGATLTGGGGGGGGGGAAVDAGGGGANVTGTAVVAIPGASMMAGRSRPLLWCAVGAMDGRASDMSA